MAWGPSGSSSLQLIVNAQPQIATSNAATPQRSPSSSADALMAQSQPGNRNRSATPGRVSRLTAQRGTPLGPVPRQLGVNNMPTSSLPPSTAALGSPLAAAKARPTSAVPGGSHGGSTHPAGAGPQSAPGTTTGELASPPEPSSISAASADAIAPMAPSTTTASPGNAQGGGSGAVLGDRKVMPSINNSGPVRPSQQTRSLSHPRSARGMPGGVWGTGLGGAVSPVGGMQGQPGQASNSPRSQLGGADARSIGVGAGAMSGVAVLGTAVGLGPMPGSGGGGAAAWSQALGLPAPTVSACQLSQPRPLRPSSSRRTGAPPQSSPYQYSPTTAAAAAAAAAALNAGVVDTYGAAAVMNGLTKSLSHPRTSLDASGHSTGGGMYGRPRSGGGTTTRPSSAVPASHASSGSPSQPPSGASAAAAASSLGRPTTPRRPLSAHHSSFNARSGASSSPRNGTGTGMSDAAPAALGGLLDPPFPAPGLPPQLPGYSAGQQPHRLGFGRGGSDRALHRNSSSGGHTSLDGLPVGPSKLHRAATEQGDEAGVERRTASGDVRLGGTAPGDDVVLTPRGGGGGASSSGETTSAALGNRPSCFSLHQQQQQQQQQLAALQDSGQRLQQLQQVPPRGGSQQPQRASELRLSQPQPQPPHPQHRQTGAGGASVHDETAFGSPQSPVRLALSNPSPHPTAPAYSPLQPAVRPLMSWTGAGGTSSGMGSPQRPASPANMVLSPTGPVGVIGSRPSTPTNMPATAAAYHFPSVAFPPNHPGVPAHVQALLQPVLSGQAAAGAGAAGSPQEQAASVTAAAVLAAAAGGVAAAAVAAVADLRSWLSSSIRSASFSEGLALPHGGSPQQQQQPQPAAAALQQQQQQAHQHQHQHRLTPGSATAAAAAAAIAGRPYVVSKLGLNLAKLPPGRRSTDPEDAVSLSHYPFPLPGAHYSPSGASSQPQLSVSGFGSGPNGALAPLNLPATSAPASGLLPTPTAALRGTLSPSVQQPFYYHPQQLQQLQQLQPLPQPQQQQQQQQVQAAQQPQPQLQQQMQQQEQTPPQQLQQHQPQQEEPPLQESVDEQQDPQQQQQQQQQQRLQEQQQVAQQQEEEEARVQQQQEEQQQQQQSQEQSEQQRPQSHSHQHQKHRRQSKQQQPQSRQQQQQQRRQSRTLEGVVSLAAALTAAVVGLPSSYYISACVGGPPLEWDFPEGNTQGSPRRMPAGALGGAAWPAGWRSGGETAGSEGGLVRPSTARLADRISTPSNAAAPTRSRVGGGGGALRQQFWLEGSSQLLAASVQQSKPQLWVHNVPRPISEAPLWLARVADAPPSGWDTDSGPHPHHHHHHPHQPPCSRSYLEGLRAGSGAVEAALELEEQRAAEQQRAAAAAAAAAAQQGPGRVGAWRSRGDLARSNASSNTGRSGAGTGSTRRQLISSSSGGSSDEEEVDDEDEDDSTPAVAVVPERVRESVVSRGSRPNPRPPPVPRQQPVLQRKPRPPPAPRGRPAYGKVVRRGTGGGDAVPEDNE
ncbi:hypothetical protein Agub_g4694 [Astrephomene gubernaculifera]|uniref:Uncharacterized protein n=1 Tax=Astrephomene gubernaculifera TaxID=47775 RepID=A0AAD3HJZ1_9CHLO|nr:hypothetical protein Agub_g4694 [Astrephomene gubernaculifera]